MRKVVNRKWKKISISYVYRNGKRQRVVFTLLESIETPIEETVRWVFSEVLEYLRDAERTDVKAIVFNSVDGVRVNMSCDV